MKARNWLPRCTSALALTLAVVVGGIAVAQSNGQSSTAESEFERRLADLETVIGGSQIVAEPQVAAARATRRGDPCDCADEPAFDPTEFRTNLVEIATDPTCGWCRRQHAEIDELRRNGWDVRYVPFPLDGPESPAGLALATAKCKGDTAVDRLMETGDLVVDDPLCEEGRAWVAEGKRVLGTLGVHATPTFVIGGRLFEGYRTAAEFGDAPAR